MDWTSPLVWTSLAALFLPVLVQVLKALAPRLEGNRWATRVVVVATVVVGTLLTQLCSVGWPVDWVLVAQQSFVGLASAELSWQWIVKRWEGLKHLREVAVWDVS